MTQTATSTATFARFALLEMQVRTLLRETAGASEAAINKVSKGLADPHYIEAVAVHGVFNDGTKGAELRVQIDWRSHAIHVKAGGGVVHVPSTWVGGVAPSMTEAVRTFNQAVTVASLKPEWVVYYASHFNRDSVNSLLGFVPATHRKWARTPDEAAFGFGPLSEASLVVGLAI